MAAEAQLIMDELKGIKEELDFIKENMPSKDMFLTTEEKVLLEESFQHEKEGKLVSDEELRKRLGI